MVTEGGPHKAPLVAHTRLDIQGLRAVAVLLVVAFHAGRFVPGGFIGVDVFLVISGFVITGMLAREHSNTGAISLRAFYPRRIKRLLPALALLTTVASAASVFLDSPFASQLTAAKTGLGVAKLRAVLKAPDRSAIDVGLGRILRRPRKLHESLKEHRGRILPLTDFHPPTGRIEALNNNWDTSSAAAEPSSSSSVS